MKSKTLAIVFTVLGVTSIVAGNSILVYNIFADEDNNAKLLQEVQNNVTASLTSFKTKVDDFTNARMEYSEKVEADLFIEETDEYKLWIQGVDKYTESLDEVDNSSEYLKKICLDEKNHDKEIRNKCDAFFDAYETVVNYYVNDVNNFNNTIGKFNDEVKDELNKYELKYDYIDINSDGYYTGKE